MNKSQLINSLKQEGFPKEILNAFGKVPRENFISEEIREEAYDDKALLLENGATISQPYTIAFMLDLLEIKPNQKILEIGSGCGYVLALIGELSPNSEIYGIEILQSLAKKSKSLLSKYSNIKIINKNGHKGLSSHAPFDRILISAAAGSLPKHLIDQLSPEGIIVAPIKVCV